MKKLIISVLLIISCIYISQNYYQNIFANTILESKNEKLVQQRDLIGTWEIKKLWEDYGCRIKQITFNSYGKIYYNPSLEKENSETMIGNYETTSDSIKIKFYKKSIFEFYKYTIVNDSLYLMKIDTYAPDDYMLNNYPEENIWKRIYN